MEIEIEPASSARPKIFPLSSAKLLIEWLAIRL